MRYEIGNVVGRLTILDVVRAGKKTFCKCKCECGTIKSIRADHISSGRSKSCGCLAAELSSERNATHGWSNTSEYSTWGHMVQRCINERCADYGQYGGRGISVHPSWVLSFDAFISDMGEKPTPSHSIDRIDVNGNYEPGNCRWATPHEQARNKRSARTITAFGRTQSIHDWADEIGLTGLAIWKRIERGMTPEAAVISQKYKRGM